MVSKYRIGAEEATAPRAICGYFSRNHDASTAKLHRKEKNKLRQSMKKLVID